MISKKWKKHCYSFPVEVVPKDPIFVILTKARDFNTLIIRFFTAFRMTKDANILTF